MYLGIWGFGDLGIWGFGDWEITKPSISQSPSLKSTNSPRPVIIRAPMILTEKLTKHYGGNAAVSDLSFNVEPGEFLGFLGPNGAGKSTTVKILTGLIPATSG